MGEGGDLESDKRGTGEGNERRSREHGRIQEFLKEGYRGICGTFYFLPLYEYTELANERGTKSSLRRGLYNHNTPLYPPLMERYLEEEKEYLKGRRDLLKNYFKSKGRSKTRN
jgi:hypothetical protein